MNGYSGKVIKMRVVNIDEGRLFVQAIDYYHRC